MMLVDNPWPVTVNAGTRCPWSAGSGRGPGPGARLDLVLAEIRRPAEDRLDRLVDRAVERVDRPLPVASALRSWPA